MRPAPKMCIRGVTQPKSVNQLRNKFPACQSLSLSPSGQAALYFDTAHSQEPIRDISSLILNSQLCQEPMCHPVFLLDGNASPILSTSTLAAQHPEHTIQPQFPYPDKEFDPD